MAANTMSVPTEGIAGLKYPGGVMTAKYEMLGPWWNLEAGAMGCRAARATAR